MIACPSCGHWIGEGARSCIYCGVNFKGALPDLEELKAQREPAEEAATMREQRAKKDADVRPEWEAEKKVARRVYWWLLLSPFVTVPCFAGQIFDLSYYPTMGERVGAAVVPLIFHIPLLLGLRSSSRFVQRHTQQAFILIALRASMAALSLNLDRHPTDGLWLFFFGNGALWLLGSLWGLRQVKRGDCWLMRRRREDGELPRPWAVPAAVPTTPGAGVPSTMAVGAPVSPIPAAQPSFEVPADPNAAFEDGMRLLGVGKRAEAAACFLAAFRDGPPDLQRRAVAELERLGVVQTF